MTNKGNEHDTNYYEKTIYYNAHLLKVKEEAKNLKEHGYYNYNNCIYKFDIVKQRFIFIDNIVFNTFISNVDTYQNIPINTEVISIVLEELTEIPNPRIYNNSQYSTVPEEYKKEFETLKEILLKDGLI